VSIFVHKSFEKRRQSKLVSFEPDCAIVDAKVFCSSLERKSTRALSNVTSFAIRYLNMAGPIVPVGWTRDEVLTK
jgi:hypothetical protein